MKYYIHMMHQIHHIVEQMEKFSFAHILNQHTPYLTYK
jgi:hypothetical protein